MTLRSDHPRARLQVMGQLKWQDVCVAPCNVPVYATGLYRVGGGSIRPSDTFNMPRRSGNVVIDAEVGSSVKHWVGFGLTLAGAGAALLGGLVYATASSQNDPYNSAAATDSQHTLGIGYLIIGVALMAVGIPLSMSATTIDVR